MEHKVTLSDNRQVTIRTLEPEDKDKLHQMYRTMSEEALQYSMAPYTPDRIRSWIDNHHNLISLVAEDQNLIIGYGEIQKHVEPTKMGTSHLNIYLHQDYHHRGLGTAMLIHLLKQAQEHNIHKVNLEVVADNTPAVQLFKKHGFQAEGRIRDAFHKDGQYYDIIPMGKILNK
jgi:putative acetyltransferase